MIPIHDRILRINDEQCERYINDEPARRRYWAKHPTYFGCIKCMDGRVHLPMMTQTPLGLIKPFRAIGGAFEIWWPAFLGRMNAWVSDAMRHGKRSCVFVTYHFSASDPHLGCAGWKYDASAARAHAMHLAQELTYVFGEQLTAIVTGIETDRDEMILHGTHDLRGSDLFGNDELTIRSAIQQTFPALHPDICADLAPFLLGNASHVQNLAKQTRERHELNHNERIIAIGKGFDWLAVKNLALIISDADPNLAESIRVATSLIVKNLTNAPDGDDATIFTNIVYREPGIDYRQAVARSRGLLTFAERVIRSVAPDLLTQNRMHSICGVTWEPSKKLEVIDAYECAHDPK